MNFQTDQIEYVEFNGKKEISIVRTNLMNEQGYAPYCGAVGSALGYCSNPRTKWNGKQFQCRECGFITAFPMDFIKRYKEKWNINQLNIKQMQNLIEGLHTEMNRVREIIKEYDSIGSAGALASFLMKDSIRNAEDCIAKGDTVGMIHAISDLKEYEL